MGQKVLLLSMGYVPITILSWRKAVSLVLGRGKGEVISEYNEKYSAVFNAAIIRLTVPSPDPFQIFQKQKFSKRSTFLRDSNACQYCNTSISMRDGTLDHVLPRSRQGKTTYLNCVAACRTCNSKKDNKTPEEAGMPLRKPLRHPNIYDIFSAIETPDEWHSFLKFN